MGLIAHTLPGAVAGTTTAPPEAPPKPDRTAAPAGSQLAAFTAYLESAVGRRFVDHAALHAWSVAEFRAFWAAFLQWSRGPLALAGDPEPVCIGDEVEHARFFPLLRMSYADSVLNLQAAPAHAPAILECHADGTTRTWTRGELREQVARLAQGLAQAGVREGDHVVAVMRNDARAAAVALAVTALGATLSTASHDMGVQALLDRFGPLQPRLLLAHLEPRAFDTGTPLAAKVASLAGQLPSLESVVRLDAGELRGATLPVRSYEELVERGAAAGEFGWPRFAFNHPLFVMFSSGTTGRPKCIVHGAGGTLLEHIKEHRLHTDLRPGDRMYFHTSCGWMMWNWQLSALASGVEIVTYDGPIDAVDRLWKLVAQQQVTVFGTSPGYLKMCEEAGLAPSAFGLKALRAVLSTGAVLHDGQFVWIREHAKAVPVQSISGGTDIIGCFVLGHPDLPVRVGLAQCRSLGLDVQAWKDGRPTEGVGQLVCANPFPSRPLGFFGDEDGSRFHAAYFAQNPGVWTHGDLIEFSPDGGARLHGRSDGVINVRGIKFSPGEIYRVLGAIPGILDAMVVERRPAGASASAAAEQEVVALLVLRPGVALDGELQARVRREIATQLSAAHVPDRILDVPGLPVTHNGKPSEAAARAAVSGLPLENLSALRNPECLDAIRAHPGLRGPEPATSAAEGENLVAQVQAIWQRLLGMAHVGLEDDFFELGGNSLLAARLLRDIQVLTGRSLPLGALMCAPTVAKLASILEQDAPGVASPMLVRMREGSGRPLFMVHGMNGTTMDCWSLVRALRTPRPIWAFQARGIDGELPPHERVEDMARAYVDEMRQVQPHGPYALSGFSFGGLVAYEMAQQLLARGERVELLFLIDPHVQQDLPWHDRAAQRTARLARRLARMSPQELPGYLADRARDASNALRVRLGLMPPPRPSDGLGMAAAHQRVFDSMWTALMAYQPGPYRGDRIVFVRSTEPFGPFFDPMPVWRRVAGDRIERITLRGAHLDLVRRHAVKVAGVLDGALGGAAG